MYTEDEGKRILLLGFLVGLAAGIATFVLLFSLMSK